MDRRIFLGGMVLGASGLLAACGGDGDGGSSGGPGNPDTLTKDKLADVFKDFVGTYDVYPNHWNDGTYTGDGAIGADFVSCQKCQVELKSDGTVVVHGENESYTFGPDDLIEEKSQDVGYEVYVNYENADGIGMKWQSKSPDDSRNVSKDDGFFIIMGGDNDWANPDNYVALYSEDMMADGICPSVV